MNKRRQDFALGLTAIVMLAVLLGTLLFLYPNLSLNRKHLVVQFQHELGLAPLKPGSPVVLAGALDVGRVTRVYAKNIASPTEPAESDLYVVVEAELDPNVELYSDCRITSDEPPVGGSGVLVILDVGTPGKPLAEGQAVRGLPPQSLAAVIGTLSRRLVGPGGLLDRLDQMFDVEAEGSLANKIAASLDDVNDMTGHLRVELSPTEQSALLAKVHVVADDVLAVTHALREQAAGDDPQLIVKLHAALDALNSGLRQANDLLSESTPSVRATLMHLEQAAASIDEDLLASLRAELDRDDTGSLLGQVHAAMTRVNASLADIQLMSDTGRRVLVANRPAVQRTVDNIKEMSGTLRLASEEIRLAPWRLLYRPTPQEKEEMSVFEAARTFAEAATYLDDAAARLEAVAASMPAGATAESDEELQAIQESLRAAFDRFQRAEDYLWKRMEQP